MTQNKRGSQPVKRIAASNYLIEAGEWVSTSKVARAAGFSRSTAVRGLRLIKGIRCKEGVSSGHTALFWRLTVEDAYAAGATHAYTIKASAVELARDFSGMFGQLFWATGHIPPSAQQGATHGEHS